MTKDEAPTSPKDAALKLALEALEDLSMKHYEITGKVLYKETFTAIKEALAQPVQEPVACIIDGDLYHHHEIDWEDLVYQGQGIELLYTTPPAAQPAQEPLTDEEIDAVCEPLGFAQLSPREVARAIEAKLKEKNESQ